MKTKKITRANLYTQLPLEDTIVWWLLLDRLNASGIAWGVFWTLTVIIWLAVIIEALNSERVDIFKEGI